jgi:urease accessory protein
MDHLPLLRLLQLASSGLPIGGYSYSQGIEWAVERGWICDAATLNAWLGTLITGPLTTLEIPIFARLYHAAAAHDSDQLRYWSDWLLASRETRELRDEERQRGRALATLLVELDSAIATRWQPHLPRCQSSAMAIAASHWQIPLASAAHALAWSWLEATTLAGVKLVPLGQTAGQRLLFTLAHPLAAAIENGLKLRDSEIGGSAPALAIASSRHEGQYTRLFRS